MIAGIEQDVGATGRGDRLEDGGSQFSIQPCLSDLDVLPRCSHSDGGRGRETHFPIPEHTQTGQEQTC